MTDNLYQVSADEIDRALSALSAIARRYSEAAQILRTIKARSHCVGRVFHAGRVPAIQAVLPGYRVAYSIESRLYEGLDIRPRMLHIIRLDEQGQPMIGAENRWSFPMAKIACTKLTPDHMNALIEYYDEKARESSLMAADLPAKAAAYNAAAAYLQPIKRDLDAILRRAGM